MDEHSRARSLSITALDDALAPADAAWLTAHLEACRDCLADSGRFEADRERLRALRDREPTPPRDLWARTSAAIEREVARDRRRAASRSARSGTRRRAAAPGSLIRRDYRYSPGSSAMKSLLVVLIALAATSLVNQVIPVSPSPTGGVASGRGATPIPVSADVGWLQTGTDGTYDLFLTRIDQVCPSDDASACQPVKDTARGSIALGSRPRSVSLSPDAGHLVVISSAAASGGSVMVVAVPTARPSSAGSPVPSGPGRSATATIGPAVTPPITARPSLGGSPLASVGAASPGATVQPDTVSIADAVVVVGGTASYSPDGTWFAFSARPADGSSGPDIYLWRVGDPKARAVTSDHRSVFSAWLGNRLIGSRVDEPGRPVRTPVPTASSAATSGAPAAAIHLLAGETPAASTPAVQTPSAAPVTSQPSPAERSPSPRPSATPTSQPEPGRTTEPSGSPGATPPPVGQRVRGATSFLMDPATLAIEEIEGNAWRPVVDPTGRWVVYWDGSLAADAAGIEWQPATGRMVVAPWRGPTAGLFPSSAPASRAPGSTAGGPAASTGAASPAGGASGPAATAGGPGASARASAAPAGSQRPPASPGPHGVVDGPLMDFDAQFDPTGHFLAVWVANPTDPANGFLTLYAIDEATGAATPAHAPLVALPALRGFSIVSGRLAWVSPPASGGAGSRIEIIGWTSSGFGTVESLPAESLLVVR